MFPPWLLFIYLCLLISPVLLFVLTSLALLPGASLFVCLPPPPVLSYTSLSVQPAVSSLSPAPSPPTLYLLSIFGRNEQILLTDSFFSALFFRWRPQHFSAVRPASPHHHRGHAGQQRHCPPPEHVPGALFVTPAGELPGGRIGGALCTRRRRFCLQHPAGSGCGARRDPECQLLCCFAWWTILPF